MPSVPPRPESRSLPGTQAFLPGNRSLPPFESGTPAQRPMMPGCEHGAEPFPLPPIMLPADHPACILRDATQWLSARFDQFLDELSEREPAGFGFGQRRNVEPVRIESLTEACREAVQLLQVVIHTPPLDPLAFRAQEIAKDLKLWILRFRISIGEVRYRSGVPENEVSAVLTRTAIFQRILGNPMTDAQALSRGIMIQRQYGEEDEHARNQTEVREDLS